MKFTQRVVRAAVSTRESTSCLRPWDVFAMLQQSVARTPSHEGHRMWL
eukprot:CAMPEP_0174296668 /NCGR_PEP_ID=MMETSP0809-20121228/48555_1 /TAXON_ID=73025 ORGANISM="Eutreptiella gymnastica-like, Strain CCMP1594" /NCGR_SAMPLE_ID=MMETSP0809 /ASSEMBLY_ACC=CAM_ASM_000658 /LENGTH=47 /DNA_ID= /DNA_START= /DNA_END= /DNA_ORIENTATION=